MKKNVSFISPILWTFTVSFLSLWILFSLLGIFVYRDNMKRLVQGEVWWLRVYSQSILGDLQVGNLHSMERKIQLLTQKGNFRSVRFNFGGQAIESSRVLGSGNGILNGFLRWLLLSPSENRLALEVKDPAQTVWGTLTADVDEHFLIRPVADSLMAYLCYSGAIFLMIFGGIYLYIEKQLHPLTRLAAYISSFVTVQNPAKEWAPLLAKKMEFDSHELQMLCSEFKSAMTNILRLEEENKAQRVKGEISKIALQVAHDIRSPLSALEMVTAPLEKLPEDSRQLIRNAIGRIRDIANELLRNARVKDIAAPVETKEVLEVEFVSGLIESIVSEKRVQWRRRLGVTISTKIDARSYGLFAKLHPAAFKRVLSNLIDNAVEAVDATGDVGIEYFGTNQKITIVIRDTGRGIPAALVPQLGNPGVTVGKSDGKGLGLFYAKEEMQRLGGTLAIRSTEGSCTTITLRLPRVSAPEWFMSELTIPKGTTVAVVDDDISIHEVWRHRLIKWVGKGQVRLEHFSKAEEIETWLGANNRENVLYLMDYELLGDKVTGIEVIQKLGISEKSVLVTGHYFEKPVIDACSKLRVRIIPKGGAPYIPIH